VYLLALHHRALSEAHLWPANLAGSETITAPHVAEALQYRARGDVG
jgi:predicted ATPase with chaperone activity